MTDRVELDRLQRDLDRIASQRIASELQLATVHPTDPQALDRIRAIRISLERSLCEENICLKRIRMLSDHRTTPTEEPS